MLNLLSSVAMSDAEAGKCEIRQAAKIGLARNGKVMRMWTLWRSRGRGRGRGRRSNSQSAKRKFEESVSLLTCRPASPFVAFLSLRRCSSFLSAFASSISRTRVDSDCRRESASKPFTHHADIVLPFSHSPIPPHISLIDWPYLI